MRQESAEMMAQQFLASVMPLKARQSAKFFAIDIPLDSTNAVLSSVKGPIDFGINAVGDPPEWAFFIDKDPRANWEHSCSYVVTLRSVAAVVKNDTAPPTEAFANKLRLLTPLSEPRAAFSIWTADVSIGPDKAVVIASPNLLHAILRYPADTISFLSAKVSPIQIGICSVDSVGRLIVSDTAFATKLRAMSTAAVSTAPVVQGVVP